MREKELINFFMACQGNWRNALYISGCSMESPKSPHNADYLCAMDLNGIPCFINVHDLQGVMEEFIEKDDCLVKMTCRVFRSLYKNYWDQYVDFPQRCGMQQLYLLQQMKKRE